MSAARHTHGLGCGMGGVGECTVVLAQCACTDMCKVDEPALVAGPAQQGVRDVTHAA